MTKFIPSAKKVDNKSQKTKSQIKSSKSVDFLYNNNKTLKKYQRNKIFLPSIIIKKSKTKEQQKNKIDMIQNITKNIDYQTRKLENLCKSTNLSISESEIISNAYIKSIQAKLDLLNNLQES